MQDKVKPELERMVEIGVIKPVTKQSKEKIRLCIDPRDLNQAIKRQQHPMRTVEEDAIRIPNPIFFAVLDVSNGFGKYL